MSRAATYAKRALLGAVFLFIALYLVRNATQLADYDYSISAPHVAGGFLVAVLAYLLGIAAWVRTANQCGAHASWRRHALVWATSRLARYLPGKVAAIYLRIDGYAGQRARAGVSLYIEVTSSLIAACGFILSCWLVGVVSLSLLHVGLMAAALCILLALTARQALVKLSGFSAAFRGLVPPEVFPGYWWWAVTVLLQVGIMLLQGLSLFLVVAAVADPGRDVLLELTVYYYFAGLAGMLALFAPAGIGVREAVLAGFLQTLVPVPAAIAAVALARIVTVVAECALGASFQILEGRPRDPGGR